MGHQEPSIPDCREFTQGSANSQPGNVQIKNPDHGCVGYHLVKLGEVVGVRSRAKAATGRSTAKIINKLDDLRFARLPTPPLTLNKIEQPEPADLGNTDPDVADGFLKTFRTEPSKTNPARSSFLTGEFIAYSTEFFLTI
jgi:hypothetical protein